MNHYDNQKEEDDIYQIIETGDVVWFAHTNVGYIIPYNNTSGLSIDHKYDILGYVRLFVEYADFTLDITNLELKSIYEIRSPWII